MKRLLHFKRVFVLLDVAKTPDPSGLHWVLRDAGGLHNRVRFAILSSHRGNDRGTFVIIGKYNIGFMVKGK